MSSVLVLPVPWYKATSAPVCRTFTYHGAQAESRQAKNGVTLIEIATNEDNKVDKDGNSSDNRCQFYIFHECH